MAKDILHAWNNRVEISSVSDPGMGPHVGDTHRTTTVVTQYKDGKVVSKKEEVYTMPLKSPYPSLTELLSNRFPVFPKVGG